MKALAGTSDSMEQLVFGEGVRVFDDRNPLWRPKVVAEDSSSDPGPLIIGSGDQLLEKVSSQARLGLENALQPGQFDGEHDGAVFKRQPLFFTSGAAGINQSDHRECFPSYYGCGRQPVTNSDWRWVGYRGLLEDPTVGEESALWNSEGLDQPTPTRCHASPR